MVTHSHWRRVWRGLFLLSIAIGTFLTDPASGQDTGSVSGTVVSSWDGSLLGGATVTVRGTTLAIQTDSQGRFKLDGVPPGDQVLRFSKSSYAAAVVTDVRILPGQTTTVNGNLRPEFYEMEEYEVTAEEFTQQSEQIMIERQNSVSMTDALGSDFLSRVGAGNAAESIAKVSGATIVDGKFAVIRGLNDRYVTTTLNGASLPSADPYRQSASLDLFPSQVIDRVVVAKTFTPDQPGTYTGGGIDVLTKSYPERPFFSFSLGLAYNTQSSLNDNYLTYDGGKHDWAGLDDGGRALPPSVNSQVPINPTGQAVPPPVPGNLRTNSQNFQNNLLLDSITKDFGVTEFAPKTERAPLDYNFSMAGGGSATLLGNPFGYFAGVSYKQEYRFYDNGLSQRYWSGDELKNSYKDARSLSTVNWSGMVNLGYKIQENHDLGFTFFYNQNATDDVRAQYDGYEASSDGTFRKFNLYWTQRNLNTYQMRGTHLLPKLADTRFDWMVALTQTTQEEPNARFFNDRDDGSGFESGANNPAPKDPTRYYRDLVENNRNEKLDWTVPFESWTREEAKLKFGLFDSYSQRDFTDRAFYYPGHGGYDNDPNQFLDEDNLGIVNSVTNRNGTVRQTFGDYVQVFDSLYNGDRSIQAAYPMLELPVVKTVTLVGGVRVEHTDMNVHSESYLASSITSERINDAVLEQTDWLPAVGLIWAMNKEMNLRANYSQTVARPTFRELAAYYSYDPTIGDFIEGNPLLAMTSIVNYDLRWEWFLKSGDLISVSLFYKELTDAIERSDLKVDSEVITFKNRPEATLYGVELEGRKNLGFLGEPLEQFSLGGNLSLVQSEAKLLPEELDAKQDFFPDISSTRPLFDQSPYIFNADLSYRNDRSGTTLSLIFNIAGPRITITKLNAQDVYERPAPVLDLVASQKLGKNASIKFTAKNLLNPVIKRTYGEDTDLIYSSYTRGRTFGLSFSYDF